MAVAHAVALKFQSSQWNKYNETSKDWSCKWHFTGDTLTNPTDIGALVAALMTNVLGFMDAQNSCVQALYYPRGSDINTWQAAYTPGTHVGNLANWTLGGSWGAQQLEVCHLLRCPEKISAKGKQIYLRKYFHVGACNNDAPGTNCLPFALSSAGSTALGAWSTGIGPAENVVTGPSGVAPTATWQVTPWLVTRQLRRGSKK